MPFIQGYKLTALESSSLTARTLSPGIRWPGFTYGLNESGPPHCRHSPSWALTANGEASQNSRSEAVSGAGLECPMACVVSDESYRAPCGKSLQGIAHALHGPTGGAMV